MSVTLTPENKRTLKRLLQSGHWGNESEILRYGLRLVEQEFEAHLKEHWPEPIPKGELARIYRRESKEEQEMERQLAEASMRHAPEPIE